MKNMSIINGWYKFAKKTPSDNFNSRYVDSKITLIVIHGISLPPKVFRGNAVIDFFQNRLDFSLHQYYENLRTLKVSAHFFIRRRGGIYQFVSCENRAWHAGKSFFKGQEECNDFSIGIELEGSDDTPYTPSQYKKLNILIAALKTHYPITDIAAHSDIAPNRKTDPGKYFDWEKVIKAN